MARLIAQATEIRAAGNPPKVIREHVGRLNSGDEGLSIARMQSPSGWGEPGQTPEFAEYTLVLKGVLRVELKDGMVDVKSGQTIAVEAGEWVRYSTPGPEGAEYVSVCLPAFSPDLVRRDAE